MDGDHGIGTSGSASYDACYELSRLSQRAPEAERPQAAPQAPLGSMHGSIRKRSRRYGVPPRVAQ